MNSDDIKKYIDELLRLENEIIDENGDEKFINELDSLLNNLSNDIRGTYTVKTTVKVKKLNKDAIIPKYAKNGDAGMDLTAVSKTFDDDGNVVYGTGLALEIPKNYVGLLFPRSSNAKKELTLTNSVGVIDSGYRGEIMLKFKPSPRFGGYGEYKEDKAQYNIGDRVGQIIIIPYPEIEFVESETLSDSERGDGGYGHTGF